MKIAILTNDMTKKFEGYEITEEDIQKVLNSMREENPEASREDAIQFLEGAKATMHLAAHKIVNEEKAKKIKTKKKTKQ